MWRCFDGTQPINSTTLVHWDDKKKKERKVEKGKTPKRTSTHTKNVRLICQLNLGKKSASADDVAIRFKNSNFFIPNFLFFTFLTCLQSNPHHLC